MLVGIFFLLVWNESNTDNCLYMHYQFNTVHVICMYIFQYIISIIQLLQVPVLWLPLKCLPTLFGVIAASVALFNNFKIILVERGAGRNGSTVAVSCLASTQHDTSSSISSWACTLLNIMCVCVYVWLYIGWLHGLCSPYHAWTALFFHISPLIYSQCCWLSCFYMTDWVNVMIFLCLHIWNTV